MMVTSHPSWHICQTWLHLYQMTSCLSHLHCIVKNTIINVLSYYCSFLHTSIKNMVYWDNSNQFRLRSHVVLVHSLVRFNGINEHRILTYTQCLWQCPSHTNMAILTSTNVYASTGVNKKIAQSADEFSTDAFGECLQ